MRRFVWATGAACGVALMTAGIWAAMHPPLIATRVTQEMAILFGLLGLFAGLFLAVYGTTKTLRARPRF